MSMKKNIAGFFATVVRSIYSPDLYGELRARPVGRALMYFLFFSLALAVLQLGVAVVPLATTFPEALRAGAHRIVEAYPDELTITIRDGQARVNVPEPYFIELSPWVASDSETRAVAGDSLVRIVIDTQTPFSASKFGAYEADAWLTKDAIIARDGDLAFGGFRMYSLSEQGIRDVVLTKDKMRQIEAAAEPYLKLASPIYGAVLFVGFLVFYGIHLLYNFFLAFTIFVFSKARRIGLSYWKSYAVGLHAMTLPLIASAVLTMLKVQSPAFLFTLIAFTVVGANLWRSPEAR
ncbi:MAG: DUF1189 family protein [Candidatus Colwellbacteria bacterium]|nr:DUF1189 family protein [Candidatus Colwellbacteria bacterium]